MEEKSCKCNVYSNEQITYMDTFLKKFINRRYMKSALKYNNEKTRWVACFFGEMDPLKQAIKLDDLFPLVEKHLKI